MALLECKECKKEISINSKTCPNCGTNKQFKGYELTREELVSMGLKGYSDFKNFQDRGGKIKFTKTTKIILTLILVAIIVIPIYNKITEHKEIVKFEDKEFLVNLETKELIQKASRTISYDTLYDLYTKIYDNTGDKYFKEKINKYEPMNKGRLECVGLVWATDKKTLHVPDSYDYEVSNGYWKDDYTYYYEHNFKASNLMGVVIPNTTKTICKYDKKFNLIKVDRIK